MLVTVGVGQMGCAAVIISQKTSNDTPFLLNLFFIVSIVQSVLVFLMVYGSFGDFYVESDKCLATLKRLVSDQNLPNRRKQLHMHKFLNSVQIAKVRFGFSNFIEKNTPPLFQQFCIERLVDLLLVNK